MPVSTRDEGTLSTNQRSGTTKVWPIAGLHANHQQSQSTDKQITENCHMGHENIFARPNKIGNKASKNKNVQIFLVSMEYLNF